MLEKPIRFLRNHILAAPAMYMIIGGVCCFCVHLTRHIGSWFETMWWDYVNVMAGATLVSVFSLKKRPSWPISTLLYLVAFSPTWFFLVKPYAVGGNGQSGWESDSTWFIHNYLREAIFFPFFTFLWTIFLPDCPFSRLKFPEFIEKYR